MLHFLGARHLFESSPEPACRVAALGSGKTFAKVLPKVAVRSRKAKSREKVAVWRGGSDVQLEAVAPARLTGVSG